MSEKCSYSNKNCAREETIASVSDVIELTCLISMDLCGLLLPYVALYDLMWPCLVLYAVMWPRMLLFMALWVVVSMSNRPFMSLFGLV